MRASSPVAYDSRHGVHNVFLYEDVKTVLSDFARFSSQRGRGQGSQNPDNALADSIISTDPPRHRQLRALVERAFTPRQVEALAPRISELTHELLDGFSRDVDFVRDFAEPLPVIVIAEILGIPVRDRRDFKRWSDAVVSGRHDGMREMATYFSKLIARRRDEGQDGEDLVSALLRAEVDGAHLTSNELLGFCILLLVAGNETTTNLLTNAVQVLSDHPGVRDELVSNPDLWPSTVEEVLRLRSPVQSMFRVSTESVELSGVTIPANAWVIAWIGSANHDERVFEMPDVFEPRRSPNRHLAFGHGVHFCLGAPLARLEATIALRAVYERFPHLRAREDAELKYIDSTIVHGVKELPVHLSVEAAS
ncbi:cytochrome P450 [Deinococcus yavapaiensis KR-236]|uniref:Cytochrome P450 n=2 Tax=Deinococcus TaxID=1298 RepID=A0A318SB61_9DEIO|nr:cytochrome P450 [Deinococcus yavapaiensis KR-236]